MTSGETQQVGEQDHVEHDLVPQLVLLGHVHLGEAVLQETADMRQEYGQDLVRSHLGAGPAHATGYLTGDLGLQDPTWWIVK